MYRDLVITKVHSRHSPTEKMVIKLKGGSPWFAWIWIDDVCYTIRKTLDEKTVVIEKI